MAVQGQNMTKPYQKIAKTFQTRLLLDFKEILNLYAINENRFVVVLRNVLKPSSPPILPYFINLYFYRGAWCLSVCRRVCPSASGCARGFGMCMPMPAIGERLI